MSDSLARYLAPGTVPDVIRAYGELSDRALSAVFGLEDEVVIVDIETTGIDPERDRIIEVAALLCRGPETVDRFHTMVDPGRRIPEAIVQLTGIATSMVRGEPSPAEAASALVDFVGGREVIAHNAAFDREFLQRAVPGRGFVEPWLDSVRLTQIALPRLRSHTLSDLAAVFGVHTPTHRAGDDVEALARIWRIALCGLDLLPRALVQELATALAGYDPKLSATLAQVSFDQRAAAFDLREERKRLVSADDAEAMRDAREVELRIPSEAELVEAFSDSGLAGRMYESFEARAEQLQMARAVTEAFAEGRHAAIEAGTGVGKSLAYLAPAAYIAQASGVGIGIATKTNSLLDQLVHGELPALSSAMEADFRYVSLKGYDHYPCLRKLEKVMSDPQDMQAQEIVS
ncbi:MAG: exonuclease domain-containing protein, partial [Actinobacteria bacterium]|nr:exonuclease domain-containing protein [Actinomycetota bacterium]